MRLLLLQNLLLHYLYTSPYQAFQAHQADSWLAGLQFSIGVGWLAWNDQAASQPSSSSSQLDD
jgi:hypothetical protein